LIEFAAYQDAHTELKKRLGRYCSYCERTVPVGLAVEHKLPKEHHPHLERDWQNFLLACANCNSSKGARNPAPGSVLWPDEHDTLSMMVYRPSGAIGPAPGLEASMSAKVAATLALLGLSRPPFEAPTTDHRHDDRLEIWRKAQQSKIDLAARDVPEMRRSIIETAKSSGGYSIWQTVFATDLAMQRELAENFPGTRPIAVAP
jgi:uncharacterized protein (TIGR02646 family)